MTLFEKKWSSRRESKMKNIEGEFKNGKRHGKGVLTFNSHKRYEGEFKNGVRTGKGTLLCSAYTFKGEFLDGLPHG